MIKGLSRAAAILSLAMIVGCAPVQAPPPIRTEVPERPLFGEQVPLITLMLWHARDLSLTGEQMRALEALRSDFQQDAETQTTELQRIEGELQRLLGRQEIDLAQVEARIRRIEGLRADLRLSRIKTVERAKVVLTPEQWQKLQPLVRGGP